MSKLKTNQLIATETAETAAQCLRTIAHPIRIRIIGFILPKEHSVQEISNTMGIKQPAASEHLRIMEARGILSRRREGKRVFYKVALMGLKGIIDCIKSQKLG